MPDDPLIRATTTIDVTGAKAGLAVLKEEYRQASTDVRQSVQRVVDAERQATEAIAAGHAQLGAVLQKAAAEERSALDSLISKQLELKSALDQASVAQSHQVSQMAAASGTIRVFEGALPIRAVENFATKTLGLGPILQAAFPVIGAIALGEAIYRVWEKTDPLIAAEKALAIETKKLDEQYAQLGKHLEALKIEQITAEFGKAAGSKLAAFYSQTSLEEDASRINYLSNLIQRTQERDKHVKFTINPGVAFGDMRQREADAKDIERYQDEISGFQMKATVASQQAATDQAKAAKESAAEAKTAMRQHVEDLRHADEEAVSDLKATGEFTLAEQRAFWTERLTAESGYADRYREIKRQLGTIEQEEIKASKKNHAEQMAEDEKQFEIKLRGIEDQDERVAAAVKRGAEEQKRAQEEARKILSADTQAGSIGRQADLGQEKQGAERSRALSVDRTPQAEIAYLEALKQVDQKIITEKVQTQMRLIQIDGMNDPAKAAEDVKKLAEIQRQGQQQMYADETKILISRQAQYRQFFDTITRGMQQTIEGWISGQRSFAAGLQSIWSGILSQFVNYQVQRVSAWLAGTAAIHTAEAALSSILQAIHLTTAAATVATDKTSGADQILTGAAVAAVNTFAAISAIPIIGPEIAPAAASAAYAEALGFGALAAFDTGTAYVPSTGVALIHKGERIIDARSNQQITQALAGGGGGGHTFNLGGITVNGGGGTKQTAESIFDELQAVARRKNMRMA